jgi:hypothetical protein
MSFASDESQKVKDPTLAQNQARMGHPPHIDPHKIPFGFAQGRI